jgi:hypothetical protein
LLYSDEYKIERETEKRREQQHTSEKVEQEKRKKKKGAEQMRGEKRVVYVQYIVGGAGGCQDNKDLTRY